MNSRSAPYQRSSIQGTSAWRIALVVLVALASLWLGDLIVGDTISSTSSDPVKALAVRPHSSRDLIALAEQRLVNASNQEDISEVVALSGLALGASPLEAGALRLLGLTAEIKDQPAYAEGLMTLAVARSRRDALAQLWLLRWDLDRGVFSDAVDRIDIIARSRPDIRSLLLPAVVALSGTPAGRNALVGHFVADPPWRSWALAELGKAGDPAAIHDLLTAVQESPVPVRDGELRPFVEQLIGQAHYDFAYLVWLKFLPNERQASLPYVYNGSFDYPPTGIPFDWVLSAVTGATTEAVANGETTALRVTFSDTRVNYRHVKKLLILPPGEYTLHGAERALDLVNQRGLAWRLRCFGSNQPVIGESPALTGTEPWRAFSVRFSVEPACAAQWLTLELLARIPSEEHVSGEAWFDDLRVERAGPGA